VRPRERRLLRSFFIHYCGELSVVGGPYVLDDQGRVQPDHLPHWLTKAPDRHALLLLQGVFPVGFALVGVAPFPWMSPGRDVCLSEFFVAPTHRSCGIGRAAALQLFDRFPGKWEVCELPRHERAIAFWRRVIGEYTHGDFRELQARGGPAQHFENGRP
jgi:predicted acetyltransferase